LIEPFDGEEEGEGEEKEDPEFFPLM